LLAQDPDDFEVNASDGELEEAIPCFNKKVEILS